MPNYSEQSEKCFKEYNYDGYLENARNQYEMTGWKEDLEKYEIAKKNYEIYKEIKRIINIDNNDYYKLLGLTKKCTIKDIKNVFRKLVERYHPNKTNIKDANIAIRMIQKAYFGLNTQEKKDIYDGKCNYHREIPETIRINEDLFNNTQIRSFRLGNIQFSFQNFDMTVADNLPFFFNERLFRPNNVHRTVFNRTFSRRTRMSTRNKNWFVFMYFILFILFIYIV